MKFKSTVSLFLLILFSTLSFLPAQQHFAPGDQVIRGNRLISIKSEPGTQLSRAEHLFLDYEITIDGKDQEEAWASAPTITPLVGTNRERDESSIRVLFDKHNIYLYGNIQQADGITATLREEDGLITSDDYFQVDLKPLLPSHVKNGRDYYYTIAVNPLGTIWDSYLDPYLDGFFFSSWDSGVEVVTNQNQVSWEIEMRIPYSGLDVYSDPGWEWNLEFRHASRHDTDRVELTSTQLGVTVTQDVMVRRPGLVSYYWPRPEFMEEVKPDMSFKPEYRTKANHLQSLPTTNSAEDSGIWNSLENVEISHTDRMGELVTQNSARARIGMNGNSLVLNLQADGARLREVRDQEAELGEGMAAQIAGVNGVFVDQALFENECFWIVVQPRSSRGDDIHADYYMIVIDNEGGIKGTHYDKYGTPSRSWEPDLEVDLYETNRGWGAEVVIDMASFSIPIDYRSAWGFNLFRNRLLENDDSELQAWSYSGNDFLDPAHFGVLEGVEGIDLSVLRAGLQREQESLLSAANEVESMLNEGSENVQSKLQGISLSTLEELREAERVLESVDQTLGVADFRRYYPSVPHPVKGGYPLMDIQFIGRHGWAVGPMGTFLRTEDGGESWESIDVKTDADLYRVVFVNRLEGWAAGGRLRISETNESMRHDRRGGYAYIFHTEDGGKTWECQFGERGRLLLGLDFVDERIGYAVGERGYLLKTVDGGQQWSVLRTTGTLNWLYGLDFLDEQTGFAVGLNQTVIKTENGGQSWTKVAAEADRYPYGFRPILRDIAFSGNTGCIVGQNGTVLISNDRGETWNPTATFFKDEIRDLMDLRSVHFVSSEEGYAVGELGTQILKTEDGGASWKYQPLPNRGWLRSVWADQEGKVMIGGEQEQVLISGDKGATWASGRVQQPKTDILVLMAHGDDAAINLNGFFAHYSINEGKTIVDVGTMSDTHSSEYEETYNLEHDRNMWMIGVRTASNFNEFETGNNGSDYYHYTERLWEGEENVIRQMVAAIRAYRPEIVITHGGVFGDYDKPGHKLSGRAGLPAFERAGGDVDYYPELSRLGLKPWQPKKLYHLASESYPATLDLASVGNRPLEGTDLTCLEFGEYVIRNFQSQGIYHVKNGKLSLVKSHVPVPENETSVFDGIE